MQLLTFQSPTLPTTPLPLSVFPSLLLLYLSFLTTGLEAQVGVVPLKVVGGGLGGHGRFVF